MHSLDGALVPILIPVERLRQGLLEHEAAFAAAPNWVAAYLSLTCAAPVHYAMLHKAMERRSALLLLDGLDEAGAERARLERHVAEVLVLLVRAA